MIQELSKHEREKSNKQTNYMTHGGRINKNLSSINAHSSTNINLLTETAWQLSSTALWNHAEFSEVKKEEARKAIRQYLKTSEDPYQAYLVYCQRVLMARQYILNNNMRLMVL